MNFSPCRCYDKEFHIPPNEPVPFVCQVKPEKKLKANYSESCCAKDFCNEFSKVNQNLTHVPETPGKHGTTLMCNAKMGKAKTGFSISIMSCRCKIVLELWKVVWLERNGMDSLCWGQYALRVIQRQAPHTQCPQVSPNLLQTCSNNSVVINNFPPDPFH